MISDLPIKSKNKLERKVQAYTNIKTRHILVILSLYLSMIKLVFSEIEKRNTTIESPLKHFNHVHFYLTNMSFTTSTIFPQDTHM